MGLGSGIRDPGSKGQKGTGPWIPDSYPQHWSPLWRNLTRFLSILYFSSSSRESNLGRLQGEHSSKELFEQLVYFLFGTTICARILPLIISGIFFPPHGYPQYMCPLKTYTHKGWTVFSLTIQEHTTWSQAITSGSPLCRMGRGGYLWTPLGSFTRCGSVESVKAMADDGMKV